MAQTIPAAASLLPDFSLGNLIPRKVVGVKLNDGRSTTFVNEAKGLIPPGIPLGPNRVVWPESEIDTIVQARVAGLSADQIRSVVKNLIEQRNGLREKLLKSIGADVRGADARASPASPTSLAAERLLKGRERAKIAAAQGEAP